MIILPAEEVPAGRYSISFESFWKHPFVGRNGYDHMVITVPEDITPDVIERDLVDVLTHTSGDRAECHAVKIHSMSRLDNE